jgi:hypothetical protein
MLAMLSQRGLYSLVYRISVIGLIKVGALPQHGVGIGEHYLTPLERLEI